VLICSEVEVKSDSYHLKLFLYCISCLKKSQFNSHLPRIAPSYLEIVLTRYNTFCSTHSLHIETKVIFEASITYAVSALKKKYFYKLSLTVEVFTPMPFRQEQRGTTT
jgi:hypothetical protein